MVDSSDGEDSRSKVIQGIITHINILEQNINALKESISEQNDLQTVNRLDIINLRNEIEKLKMSLPALSPDVAENIKAMQKLMDKKDSLSNIDKLVADVERVKKQMQSVKPEEIDEIRNEITALNESLGKGGRPPGDDIIELKRKLQDMEKSAVPARRCKKCGAVLDATKKFCGKCGKKA